MIPMKKRRFCGRTLQLVEKREKKITVDKSVKALSGTMTTCLEQVTGVDPSKPPTMTFI